MQVHHLVVGPIKSCKIPIGPFLEVPLDGIPSCKSVNCTPQLDIISTFMEDALDPFIYVIDEDSK